jgi:hypothetical protein
VAGLHATQGLTLFRDALQATCLTSKCPLNHNFRPCRRIPVSEQIRPSKLSFSVPVYEITGGVPDQLSGTPAVVMPVRSAIGLHLSDSYICHPSFTFNYGAVDIAFPCRQSFHLDPPFYPSPLLLLTSKFRYLLLHKERLKVSDLHFYDNNSEFY